MADNPFEATLVEVNVENITPERLSALMAEKLGFTQEDDEQALAILAYRVLTRGDSILVYMNCDFNSPQLGALMTLSYGSHECQFPRTDFPTPPQTCPDIVGFPPMWRYQLRYRVDPVQS